MESEDVARAVWGERMRAGTPWDALEPGTRNLLIAVADRARSHAQKPEPAPAKHRQLDWPDFRFLSGPWENSVLPTIVRRDPEGGDPHILCSIKRIYKPDAIQEMVDRSNACTDEALSDYLTSLDA